MSLSLQAVGIVKTYDSLVANDRIDFEVRKGELHALLGENGAGKSTLLNVLYGVLKPDAGTIYVNGKKARITSTRDAILKYKIGKVSQYSDLVPSFTVGENILYGEIPVKHGLFIDRARINRTVNELNRTTGFKLNATAIVEDLSVGEQQHIELTKLLYQDAEIIFLDEPSSLLAPQEVKKLFGLLKGLIRKGRSIIFVTHKLEEALDCDRITVLRAGRVTLTEERKEVSKDILLKAMFEEKIAISRRTARPEGKKLDSILEVRNLITGSGDRRGNLKKVSFTVNRGEIMGIAGIAGNGQKDILDVLTGFLRPRAGKILLKGTDITASLSPYRLRINNLLAYIPEGRRTIGSFLKLPISENMIMGVGRMSRFYPHGLRDATAIRQFSLSLIEEYGVKAAGPNARASSLSGGNLQKMIVARELSLDTDLLIVAQPTHGLDFKTAEFVHTRLIEEAEKGRGILLISKDLDEVMKLSDRIAIVYEGELRELSPREVNLDTISRLMVGLEKED